MSFGGQRVHVRCVTLRPMGIFGRLDWLGGSHARRLRAVVALVLGPLALVGAAGAADPAAPFELGRSSVHRQNFEVRPTAEPVLFTVECAPDEQLVSGGYIVPNQPVSAVFSYPSDAKGTPARSGEQPRAWTIGVTNATKTTQVIQVVAACLAGGDGQSSVQVVTETHLENAFTMSADCPDTTARSGGGYSWEYAPPKLATLAVSGSYPQGDRRWSIDATTVQGDPNAKAGAFASAYAVCLSGVAAVPSLPVRLDVLSGQPDCSTFNQFAACLVPRNGVQSARCATDQVLGGGGHHVTVGTLPGPYAVRAAAPAREGGWTIVVGGFSPNPDPISLDVTALCLAAAVVTPPPDDRAVPASWDWPMLTGVGLLVLVLLLLLASLLALRQTLRRQRVRDRQVQLPQLEVVVRATRSAYRHNEIREVL